MKEWLKKYSGILYIVFATAALIAILASGDGLNQALRALTGLEMGWVWLGALAIAAYLLTRACTLHFYLRRSGQRIGFFRSLIVSGVGQFYSAITPSASGGQPMQVIYLRRMGVPVSVGSSAVCVKLIGFQLSFMLLGGVFWLSHGRMVAAQLGSLRYLVVLGYLINATFTVGVLFTMRKSDWIYRLLNGCVKLAVKLRLTRDREKLEKRARGELDEYQRGLQLLLSNPLDAFGVLALSFLQILFYMSAVFCVYRAFHLSAWGWDGLFTLQLLLFITASFVPLPGAAGAQEGGFYLFFRGVFPESDIVGAMLCWRFFTYYLLLFAGLAAVLTDEAARWIASRRHKDGA